MRSIYDLKMLQALPFEIKIRMTQDRIRQWVKEWGEDGVYISFSGGKDSTVLLHLVRELYPDIPAVFVDTGLEYPEIREFVKTFKNVVWLKPKKTFKQVVLEYGYPFISKETSGRINEYLTTKSEHLREVRRKQIFEDVPMNCNKWKVFTEPGAPRISNKCCSVMKKSPVHSYGRKTGRKPFTGQMAEESKLRLQKWMQYGCNAFEAKNPISNPLSFWTEQDVLKYIKDYDVKICSVYGDIVIEDEDGYQYENLLGSAGTYKTTGCKRTGCMFCGYGCHLEKEKGRFQLMKETHPNQYAYIMKPVAEGGLGYKEVIDWINKNGGVNIRY